MTLADRWLRRLIWLPMAFAGLTVAGQAMGWSWSGYALFLSIAITPPLLLVLVGTIKVAEIARRKQRPREAPPPTFLKNARSFVTVAAYGLLGLVVLVVAAGLSDRGGAAGFVAGYALIGLFVLPTLFCIIVCAWLVGRGRILALVGRRKAYYRALTHNAQRRFREALDLLVDYARVNPDDQEALQALAYSLWGLDRREEALGRLDRAIQIRNTWQGLGARGALLFELGVVQEAIDDLHGSVELKPTPFAQIGLAEALISARRLDEAKHVLSDARKRWKWSPIFLLLGDSHRLLSDEASAQKAYEDATSRVRWEILNNLRNDGVLACALAHTGELREAEVTAESYLVKWPKDSHALCARAMVLRSQGRLDELEAALTGMLPYHAHAVARILADPGFTSILAEERFRQLFAWALGAQRQVTDRVRSQRGAYAAADPRL